MSKPCHSRRRWPHMATLNLRTLICLLCLFCSILDEGSYKFTCFFCLTQFLLDSNRSHPSASNSNGDAHVSHLYAAIILDEFLLMWFLNSTSSIFKPLANLPTHFFPGRIQVFRMPRDAGNPPPPATPPHGRRCCGWVSVGEPRRRKPREIYDNDMTYTFVITYNRWTCLIVDHW